MPHKEKRVMNKVAITKCGKYEYELIKKAVGLLADNSDFPDVKGKTVLVKPNILSDSKMEKNITTNPLVVKAVIELLREKGAERVWCGDSPGLPGPKFRGEGCGIWSVVQETGAEWVDFFDGAKETVFWNGVKAPQCRFVSEADIVVSVSKMKTHQLMYATGAVKNMFGTIPGLNKSPMHLYARSPENFAKLILSIYGTHKPEWSVMDGIISMEGAGPANGTLRQTGLLLASSSALALDRAEAVIMGYDPKDIPILSEAEKEEKGSTDASYPLLSAEEVAIPDFRRVEVKKRGIVNSLLLPFLTRFFDKKMAERRKAPEFIKEKCRKCRKCVDICPAKALRLDTDHIAIDTSKCIRCYCCHEMCPFDAIEIEKPN